MYGITSRSYNAEFLYQQGWSHEAHSYSTQRMRSFLLVRKDQLEIGRLFCARFLDKERVSYVFLVVRVGLSCIILINV